MAQNTVGKHYENGHQAVSRYNPKNVLNSHPQRFDCLCPFLGFENCLLLTLLNADRVDLGHLLLHAWAVNIPYNFISLLLPLLWFWFTSTSLCSVCSLYFWDQDLMLGRWRPGVGTSDWGVQAESEMLFDLCTPCWPIHHEQHSISIFRKMAFSSVL